VTKLWVIALVLSASAQERNETPTFEQYRVDKIFTGVPAQPLLLTPEERRFRTVIRQGVTKGWGVEDGVTGKESGAGGPNFAGHYAIVRWSCGSPCYMAAIVDLKTGQVFPPPHHGSGRSYFGFPLVAIPADKYRLAYRVDSRLLVANLCDAEVRVKTGTQSRRCGPHYFVMQEDGLTLVKSVFEY
jgi:hypothetical protein